jgi:MATE family multidrug resistance protein
MGVVALMYILFPHPLIRLFAPPDVSPELFDEVLRKGTWLLRFVAFYSLFDAVNLVLTGALKGAGDTAFVGWTSLICGVFGLILPTFLAIDVFHANVYVCWGLAATYICLLAMVFRYRFRHGPWHRRRLVEPGVPETRERI